MQITPLLFDLKITCNNSVIEFQKLREISQGGPLVGEISIDGKTLDEREKVEFGGPAFSYGTYLIIPYYKRFRFKLCAVNSVTRIVQFSNVVERLILIKGVSSEKVEFFTDLDNTQLHSYPLKKWQLTQSFKAIYLD